MSKNELALTRAEKGGIARAESMSKDERSASAKKAALARWSSDLPQATHDGPLQIGDSILVAAVLPNGKRLLSQGTVLQAIGRSRTPKAGTGGFSTVDGLPFFLQAEILKPFISEELMLSTTPILFRLKSGARTVGYDALLLPKICKVYQDLRDSIVHKLTRGTESEIREAKGVYKRYEKIIAACDALSQGFGMRGIIALVDDATGYRADQTKEDVLRVIAQYMSPRLVTLTKRFPPEFFEEVYRLHGWEYKPGSIHHPQYTGKFITKHVYEPLPPGVLEEMKERLPKNENGNRRSQLWRTLSIDTGIPHLDRQIADILLMMRLADSKEEFGLKFERIFGKQLQLRLQLLEEFKELTS
jgi:hypothetical protein